MALHVHMYTRTDPSPAPGPPGPRIRKPRRARVNTHDSETCMRSHACNEMIMHARARTARVPTRVLAHPPPGGDPYTGLRDHGQEPFPYLRVSGASESVDTLIVTTFSGVASSTCLPPAPCRREKRPFSHAHVRLAGD